MRPMSDLALPSVASLPTSVASYLDQVCQRFEAAWEQGQRPRIEDFLTEAAGQEQSLLFRELLGRELIYRMRAGERPGTEEYLQRFPDRGELVHSVFSQAES